MIAKIGRGANMMGVLSYNQLKVDQNKGQILATNRIWETPDGSYTVAHLYRSFAPYLMANIRTEKPVLHISLNPDPKDKVTDQQFREMADQYMREMGYAEQPYIVFKHTDIDRTHIHIVSTCIDHYGKKLPDAYENGGQWISAELWNRNMVLSRQQKTAQTERGNFQTGRS